MTKISQYIDRFKDVVIQIATPYSTGTGFYLSKYDVIVTNEHVVRDNQTVVIDGTSIDKQIVDVIYVDPKYDIAFLKVPDEHEMPPIDINAAEILKEGQTVVAVGHPYGLKFGATQGIISNLLHQENDINYIQHDAALNPGNSGGPLINSNGELIGINTFIIRDGNNIGFSLPAHYLELTIEEFLKGDYRKGVRCISCMNIVFESEDSIKYCTSCGAKITMISNIEVYEPLGINKTIEKMLTDLGYNIELARRGPNNWEVVRGSAKITISYHEKTGLIVGDALLCLLPKDNIKRLYEFLLRENYKNESLNFSVRNQDILISLLIYDQYLNSETAHKIFNQLFEAADKYDDILVKDFGAIWKEDV